MKQNYIVRRRHGPRISQSNPGSKFWTIIFQGEQDKGTYETHVDTSMENFVQWEAIVFNDEEQIVSGLRLKSKTKRLIDADSTPVVVGIKPPPAKYVEPATNNFSNLFEE